MSSYNRRNSGIDLLRLVAMFMVVTLHTLGQGGILNHTSGLSHHIAWLLETCAYSAVDCYAIISGYVGYSETEKPYHYSRALKFWVQVQFYNLGITAIFAILHPEYMTQEVILRAIFPVTMKVYWYVSAYTGLLFLIPWLNKLIRSCSKTECTHLIAMLFTVFTIGVTAMNHIGDGFSLNKGYSVLWLALLYITGAWLRKCSIPGKIRSSRLILAAVISVLIGWGFHEIAPDANTSRLLLRDASVTIVIIAFCLVCLFATLRLSENSQRMISCLSPAAFGVYLLHVQPMIWEHVLKDAFVGLTTLPPLLLPFAALGCAAGIFAFCLTVEKIRLSLFHTLGIDALLTRVCRVIDTTFESLYRNTFHNLE